MALNASDVNAGDDILAAHNNALIDDIEQHTHDGTDTAKIDFTANPETRRFSLSPANLIPEQDTNVWLIGYDYAGSKDATPTSLSMGITLPQGAIITKLNIRWFRNDAAATGLCSLWRTALSDGGHVEMAVADSNAATGFHTVEDSTIASATIDNINYSYGIKLGISPNDAATDVYFYGGYIEYTIVKPLP